MILSRSKHSEDSARSEAVKRGNREQGTRKVEGHVKRQNDFINADLDFGISGLNFEEQWAIN